jgi:hypothetical protein
MSILGPGSLPTIGLAGSAAASQQRAAGLADRDKADQAIQKLHADEVRLADRDLDDSIETEFSHGQVSDRDPDGRLPWQHPDVDGTGGEAAADESAVPRTRNHEDDRGRSLDVEA